MTVNWEIWSRKKANLQSQIREFADKKTAYNEVCLYSKQQINDSTGPNDWLWVTYS